MKRAHAELDVHFDEHIKFDGLSLAHLGLIACGISYCNRALTDGKIPRGRIRSWGIDGEAEALTAELIRRRIWKAIPEGFEIVGFLDHNRSRAEVMASLEAKKKRQAEYYKRKTEKVNNPKNNEGNNSFSTRRTGVNDDASEIVEAVVVDVDVVKILNPNTDTARAREEEPPESPSEVRLVVAQVADDLVPEPTRAERQAEREHAYRAAYCRGIEAGKGSPFAWPHGGWAQKELNDAIATHAKGWETGRVIRGEELLQWVEVYASEFASEVVSNGRATFFSNLEPKGFMRWLNSRPKHKPKRTGT